MQCGTNTWNVSVRSPTCKVPHSEGREGGREAGAAGAHQIDPLLHPRERRHIGRCGDDGCERGRDTLLEDGCCAEERIRLISLGK